MSYRKFYMTCFAICISAFTISFAYITILIFNPSVFFTESETVNTYNLTSRDKQLTIAERTYNLDEDISNTAVTETIYSLTDNIYMSKIQYILSDGTKKESISVRKDKSTIINEKTMDKLKNEFIPYLLFIILSLVIATTAFIFYCLEARQYK